MDKKNLKKVMMALIMGLVFSAAIVGCSKSSTENPTPDPGTNFPLTNLALTVTSTKDDAGSQEYRFDYDVKNTSATDYVNSASSEEIYGRFTITATDGTSYEETDVVNDLKAGKSYVHYKIIKYGAGKTIDESKNKVELHYE